MLYGKNQHCKAIILWLKSLLPKKKKKERKKRKKVIIPKWFPGNGTLNKSNMYAYKLILSLSLPQFFLPHINNGMLIWLSSWSKESPSVIMVKRGLADSNLILVQPPGFYC